MKIQKYTKTERNAMLKNNKGNEVILNDACCPLCSTPSKDNKIVYTNGFNVHQCKNCQLFYQSVPPISDTFYKNDYYNRATNKHTYESLSDRCIRKGFMSIVNNFPTKMKILEIGAGAGGATKYCISKGHDVDVIEPFTVFADKLKKEGINVKNDVFEKITLEDKKYDIIMAFHVIEHFLNPVNSIKKIYNALKDDGKFIFEMPVAVDGLVKSATYGFQVAHYCIFNPTSMKILLKDFNLTETYVGTKIHIITKKI